MKRNWIKLNHLHCKTWLHRFTFPQFHVHLDLFQSSVFPSNFCGSAAICDQAIDITFESLVVHPLPETGPDKPRHRSADRTFYERWRTGKRATQYCQAIGEGVPGRDQRLSSQRHTTDTGLTALRCSAVELRAGYGHLRLTAAL